MTEVHNNHLNSMISQTNPKPEDACKIFVGGLSWDTTQEKLNAYFSQYGEVVDCILMMDTTTKRSRGFGFVTYKDPSSVVRVLEGGPHILDNKSIDPKAAVPRFPNTNPTKISAHSNSPLLSRKCNKIFVGGIGQASEEDLRVYFQAYGNVTDVTIMMDKNTGRPRGFAFVGFESAESSEHTAQIRYHTIKGKRVEVKVAQPRDAKLSDGNCSSHSSVSPEELAKNDVDMYPDIEERLNLFAHTHQIDEPRLCEPIDALVNLRISESTLPQCTKDRIVQLLNDIWR